MILTVPLKSKLTLETRTSRLDPRASMLETIEDRVSSLESRGSSLEDRETRLSRICKNSKGFRGNDLFLERITIQYCSHTPTCTVKCFASIVIARKHSTICAYMYDSGLNVRFSSVFKTNCRPAVDDENLPLIANNT